MAVSASPVLLPQIRLRWTSKYSQTNRESTESIRLLPCQTCFLSDRADYSYPLRRLRGDRAMWLKVRANARKWFRLLRFSFFSLCGVFMEKKCHWAIGARGAGTGFDLKNKIPDLSAPVRQRFDFQSAPQQDQQTFEAAADCRYLCLCDSVECRGFNTAARMPLCTLSTKGAVDLEIP